MVPTEAVPADDQVLLHVPPHIEMFEYDTSNFSGSVRCRAPGIAQKFMVVAIEMDTMNGIFTTLPVVQLEGERLSM